MEGSTVCTKYDMEGDQGTGSEMYIGDKELLICTGLMPHIKYATLQTIVSCVTNEVRYVPSSPNYLR